MDPWKGLLSFTRDEGDADWYRRAEEEPGFVGHPPDQEWFCETHRAQAEPLTHLTLREALRRIEKP